MKIKHLSALAALSLLFAASGAMAAGMPAPQTTKPKTKDNLPVFVQVNSHGTITEMDPAYKLRPDMQRALRKTLDAMINQPAHDKHGKPIASQFIINMNLQSTPHADGTYSLKFTYASVRNVPPGKWHWVSMPTKHKVVLVSSQNAMRFASQNQQRQASATMREVTAGQHACWAPLPWLCWP